MSTSGGRSRHRRLEMKKVSVLVVDDSALVRQTLSDILSSDPRIEVMGTAADPFQAACRIAMEVPDVITLDVDMPRMDGLTFLRKIMAQHPIPVIICTPLEGQGRETALKAFEYGAVDVIDKPSLGIRNLLHELGPRICDAVVAGSVVQVRRLIQAPSAIPPKLTADVILPLSRRNTVKEPTEKVVAVGASTGGTEAIRQFLSAMPEGCPGIVVVQHMPQGFTRAFSERLDSLCGIRVKEAADKDAVLPGRALIAPGNRHLLLKRNDAGYYVEIKDGPLVSRHCPSVDVLFRSAAQYAGGNAIGVIMTGMGDDGSRGMLEMRQAGAYTIAQDEKSCVVFGMPQEAIKAGGVAKVLPLSAIAGEVLKNCGAQSCMKMLA
jgi:two-component system, chemotaxis family, protein-glutamate methylesterase/glutaminase